MITNKQNKITYQGNFLATEFAYTFPITAPEDLKVILVNNDGSQVVLKKDYFIDTVKKVVIYPGYAPGQELEESSRPPVLTDKQKLIIYRELEPLQTEDFGQVFPLNILERALDKLTILIQQIMERLSRGVTIPLGGNFNGELPAPVKANAAISINSDGTGLKYAGDPDEALANSKDAVTRITELERRYNNAKISDADSLNGKTYDELITEAQSITNAQTLQGSNLEQVRANIDASKLDGSTKEEIIAAASQPIGTIYYAIRVDTPEGSVRLDGTEYTEELFPNFYADLVAGKFPSVSYEDYSAQLSSNNGTCGLFALDSENAKFKVPCIADGTFISSVQNGNIGQYFEAGLPNIEGNARRSNDTAFLHANFVADGAFKKGTTTQANGIYGSGVTAYDLGFDASLSNPIYGNSETVTPIHVRYPLFMVLFNKAQKASEAQYGEFIGVLEGKLNKDGTNSTDITLQSIAKIANQEAKNTVIGWFMPDYSRKTQISISTGASFTAPSHGILTIIMSWDGHNTWYSIKRGLGETTHVTYNQLGGGAGSSGGSVSSDYFIEKGDVIKYYSAAGSKNFIYFCPLKGAS